MTLVKTFIFHKRITCFSLVPIFLISGLEKFSYFKEYRTLIPHVIKREREDGGKQSLKKV